jgi:NAD(P)-dependent dehydrogenase (short-subunit alcohol dehydrogenase family)
MRKLSGKVALVTGAGSGVGYAVAHSYANHGAQVVVADKDEERGLAVCESLLYAGAEAIFVPVDVLDLSQHYVLVEEAFRAFGALHIACNNAGISAPLSSFVEYPIDGLEHVTSINLSDVFYGLHYQIPALLQSGGGSIVNVSSVFTRTGNVHTGALSHEYAIQHVRIHANESHGGHTVDAHDSGEYVDGVAHLNPMRRLQDKAEVAELVLWLSTPERLFGSGAYYVVKPNASVRESE